MSSSDRRRLLFALAALPLAGCMGYEPVFRRGSAARNLSGRLRFSLTETRAGFALLEALESRFGAPGAGAYEVEVDFTIEDHRVTLTAATSLDRVTLDGKARITVKDPASGAVLFTDKLREELAYTSSSETAVTNQARRAAEDRMARALADKIVLRLAATAGDWAE